MLQRELSSKGIFACLLRSDSTILIANIDIALVHVIDKKIHLGVVVALFVVKGIDMIFFVKRGDFFVPFIL